MQKIDSVCPTYLPRPIWQLKTHWVLAGSPLSDSTSRSKQNSAGACSSTTGTRSGTRLGNSPPSPERTSLRPHSLPTLRASSTSCLSIGFSVKEASLCTLSVDPFETCSLRFIMSVKWP